MKYSAIINDLIFKDIISKTELMKIDVALKYYLLNHFLPTLYRLKRSKMKFRRGLSYRLSKGIYGWEGGKNLIVVMWSRSP